MKRTRNAGALVVAGLIAAIGLGGGAAWAAHSEVVVADDVVVLLDGRLPDETPPGRTVNVEQECWDAESIGALYGGEPRQLEFAPGIAREGEGPWLEVGDGAMVRVGASGAGFYMTMPDAGGSATPTASCDASRAVEVAADYARGHGGLPADAELWSVREVVAVGLDLGDDPESVSKSESRSRRSMGHYVEFKHAVEGIPIDSPGGGDAIKVRVDGSGGVRAYGRVWRRVSGNSMGVASGVLDARSALTAGLKAGGLETAKERVSGVVRLRDARRVYLSGSRDANVRALRPGWRFVLETRNGAREVFVDAGSGEAVDSE